MIYLDLFIPGDPAPGGSKTAIALRDKDGNLLIERFHSERYGRMVDRPKLLYVDDAAGNAKWRRQCERSVRGQYKGEPMTCRLRALFTFYVDRPKYHFIAGKFGRGLKPEYLDILHPDGPPDSLKLRRSTEDALTGIVWKDDALIVQGADEKVYRQPCEPTGCRLIVTGVVAEHANEGLWAMAGARA